MKKKIFISLILLIGLTSCKKSEIDDNPKTLLFSSGFEQGTYIKEVEYDYQIISGTDLDTSFSWPIEILGSNFAGIHNLDNDGNAIYNSVENVIGPNNNETAALYQEVAYRLNATQSPYQINNITQNPTKLYMTYWMKIDNTSLLGPNEWRAIWEYKTDNYASNIDGFRMIAFINTDNDSNLFWEFQGDQSPSTPIWKVTNQEIPVVRNEWFKVEYYIEWSNNSDGYASMKVNNQLVGEHYGATTNNNDDLDFIMLTQIYGNSHPMHQWIDDIEIWDGLPTSTLP